MVEARLKALRDALNEIEANGVPLRLFMLVYPSERKEIAIALKIPRKSERKLSECMSNDMETKVSNRAYVFEIMYK